MECEFKKNKKARSISPINLDPTARSPLCMLFPLPPRPVFRRNSGNAGQPFWSPSPLSSAAGTMKYGKSTDNTELFVRLAHTEQRDKRLENYWVTPGQGRWNMQYPWHRFGCGFNKGYITFAYVMFCLIWSPGTSIIVIIYIINFKWTPRLKSRQSVQFRGYRTRFARDLVSLFHTR